MVLSNSAKSIFCASSKLASVRFAKANDVPPKSAPSKLASVKFADKNTASLQFVSLKFALHALAHEKSAFFKNFQTFKLRMIECDISDKMIGKHKITA